jgi:hypothetical protein
MATVAMLKGGGNGGGDADAGDSLGNVGERWMADYRNDNGDCNGDGDMMTMIMTICLMLPNAKRPCS